jgi:hypothetical protein
MSSKQINANYLDVKTTLTDEEHPFKHLNNQCTEKGKRLAICTWQPSVLMWDRRSKMMKLVRYHHLNKHTFVDEAGVLQENKDWDPADLEWQKRDFDYTNKLVAKQGSEYIITWARCWLDMDNIDSEMPLINEAAGFAHRVCLGTMLEREHKE